MNAPPREACKFDVDSCFYNTACMRRAAFWPPSRHPDQAPGMLRHSSPASRPSVSATGGFTADWKEPMLTRREFSQYFLAGGSTLLVTGDPSLAGKPQVPSEQSSNQNSDLLIKGGTVIDPAQRLRAPLDVAVKDGKILAVARDIPVDLARNVISAKDKIVTPGFIDIHVHCFDGIGTGTNADRYCLGRGVTTAVDAGSVGYPMIGGFIKYVINTSITRISACARQRIRECPIEWNRTVGLGCPWQGCGRTSPSSARL